MRSGRTPYMVPIMRAMTYWFVRSVDYMMARQMGKTASTFSVIGQIYDDDPAPTLYLGPTQDNINDVIEPKIDQMLRKSRSLWSKTAKGQKYKKHYKVIGGVPLRLGWAGSDTGLKADSAALVIIDELDGIEADRPVAGEGTVRDMAQAITSSFPNGRVCSTSTPTHGNIEVAVVQETGLGHWAPSEEVISAIWRYWQESSRHEWAWPCVHCLEYFIPKSAHLRPLPEEALTPEQFEEEGHLECPHCRGKLRDSDRTWMNARGVMIQPGMRPLRYDQSWGLMTEDQGGSGPGPLVIDHEQGGAPIRVPWGDPPLRGRPSRLSFWVSGLATFSVRNSYGFIARRHMEAVRSLLPQRIQGSYNTLFGECYQQKGDTPPWGQVKKLGEAEDYSLGQVPPRVTALVAGVDLSDDALQWSIYGFVPDSDFECYLVNRGVFHGDTDQDEVWKLLDNRVLHASHDGLKVLGMGIDANHRPEKVYRYVSDRRDVCYATKGERTMDTWWKTSKAEVDARGKTKRFGLSLWRLNTDVTKSWVHSRVKHSIRSGTVVWHLPRDIDDEFCKQITAESRLIDVRGVPYWRKHRANHFLDCAAIAWFVANQVPIPKTRPLAPKQQKAGQSREEYSSIMLANDPYLQ